MFVKVVLIIWTCLIIFAILCRAKNTVAWSLLTGAFAAFRPLNSMISACFCGRTKAWLRAYSLRLFLFPHSSVSSCPRSLPSAFRFSLWWLGACAKSLESCPTLCDSCKESVAHQSPLSMGFPRWEYWSGLSFPSPGDQIGRTIKLKFLCACLCVCVCVFKK